MSEGGLLILEVGCILHFIIVVCGPNGGLEEVAQGVEKFGLFGGFKISESIGDLLLSKGVGGLGFFRGFFFVPDVPVFFDSDVLVESFGLDYFWHQQQS